MQLKLVSKMIYQVMMMRRKNRLNPMKNHLKKSLTQKILLISPITRLSHQLLNNNQGKLLEKIRLNNPYKSNPLVLINHIKLRFIVLQVLLREVVFTQINTQYKIKIAEDKLVIRLLQDLRKII